MYIKEIVKIKETMDEEKEAIVEIQVNTGEGLENLELTLNAYLDLMMHLSEFTAENPDYIPENL